MDRKGVSGMSRVLAIGDLHLPHTRLGYLQFCRDVYKQQRCDTVVFLGDIVDLHAVSYHERHPDADGPTTELLRTKDAVAEWYRAFPRATVTVGNHDRLLIRKAATGSISELALKSFAETWDTPGWSWVKSVTIDGVLYIHGDGCGGGIHPAYNTMRKMAQSVVMGHHHTCASVKYLCNPERRLFAMDVGCGIAWDKIEFLYQDRNPCKPVISLGTVIDTLPQLHVMPCGKSERYHDSKFANRGKR